jgi:hypothetical protein
MGFTVKEIEACVMVMRELFLYLKHYRNQIVLIGGWVPYFLPVAQQEILEKQSYCQDSRFLVYFL